MSPVLYLSNADWIGAGNYEKRERRNFCGWFNISFIYQGLTMEH